MSAYRQSPFSNLTPVVKNLLIINIIFFVASYLLRNTFDMDRWLAIYYFSSPNFRLWQIISYMFMHGSILHILFNMLALFMFGPILEHSVGPKRFLNLYFICGIGAIILQWVVQAIQIHSITGGFIISHPDLDSSYMAFGPVAQKLYVIYNSPMVGASGAICGVLVAFAMLYPNMEIIMLYFPVPIKAKYIIPAYLLLELWLGVKQSGGDNVAHFAHLGGALLGFLVVKFWRLNRPNNYF
ncbi:rhomboid family intramembrane serine protease [Mucilaginibacter sp. BT774]|uniref:rhomboid family intramembrane serine protease n=1 Tax=Mucilaginibacter sp. BT774 TaxID=3062276 RepID=UPI0026747C42|nr:rhomboid family intramembrane serine protease [Mucilaginibacter sp. BT774]MDO3625600.1 rhomboid family intramembrane serine protease [Mucilaginibacter sp. BT774]